MGPGMLEPGVGWTLPAPWPITPGALEPELDGLLEPGDPELEPGWDGPLFELLWEPWAGAAVFWGATHLVQMVEVMVS